MPVSIIVLLDLTKVNDYERFATTFYDDNIGYENFKGAMYFHYLPYFGSHIQWFIILANSCN